MTSVFTSSLFPVKAVNDATDSYDSDTEIATRAVINGETRILGENGTAMLLTTGSSLLDLFSSSTRIVIEPKKLDMTEVERFIGRLDVCLKNASVDDIKLFVAHGFYMRDVEEKGERMLFDLFFLRLWLHDSELAKYCFKFIGGTDGAEHFGSFKDFHQMLLVAKLTGFATEHADKYDELYTAIQTYEGQQYRTDFISFLQSKQVSDKVVHPVVSLGMKWAVSSGKSFDKQLKHKGLGYVANFCKTNASILIELSKMVATGPYEPEFKKDWTDAKLKASNFIGLQRVYRQMKSSINEYLDIPEVKMASKEWHKISISSIPARNMTKHRKAFNNEKSAKDVKKAQADARVQALQLRRYGHYAHRSSTSAEFGDRVSEDEMDLLTSMPELIESLRDLSTKVATPTYAESFAEFLASYETLKATSPSIWSVVDRVLCRFNVMASALSTSPKAGIHGAKSDLNEMVVSALRYRSDISGYDPAKIAEWGPKNPDRMVLHKQMEDKIATIAEAIEKAQLEAQAKLEAETESGTTTDTDDSVSKVSINLKRVVGLYDVSGSMESGSGSVRPIDVCIGMCYAISRLTCDTNAGHLPIGITFHESPSAFSIPQNMDFVETCHYIKSQSWGGSTNFVAAYRVYLKKLQEMRAENQRNGITTPIEAADAMFVFSDMQFDGAESRSNRFETSYETLWSEFELAGFNLPLLVYWNLNGKYDGQSVRSDTKGVITISGYDPALLKTIAECGSIVSKTKSGEIVSLSPMELMIKALTRPRYQPILDTVQEYMVSKGLASVSDDVVSSKPVVLDAVALDV
jgi:hypothetical protein